MWDVGCRMSDVGCGIDGIDRIDGIEGIDRIEGIVEDWDGGRIGLI